MATALDLSNELWDIIANCLYPGDIASFASTCVRFRYASRDILALHRQRCEQIDVVQDIDPLELPRTLRSIIRDPSLSWYPRKAIFWTCRRERGDWKRPALGCVDPDGPDSDPPSSDEDDEDEDENSTIEFEEGPLTFFNEAELAFIREVFSEKLHLPREVVSQWISKIQGGSQEPSKCALVALCPNLRTLVVTRQACEGEHPRPNCIDYFVQAIKENLKGKKDLHLPIDLFASLEHVSLQQMCCRYGSLNNYELNASDVVPFLSLPSIKSLGMGKAGSFDRGLDDRWRYENGTSNVEALDFDFCHDVSTNAGLIAASKALKHITGVRKAKEIDELHKHARSSLETLDFVQELWFGFEKTKAMSQLHEFTSLRTLYMAQRDLMTKVVNESSVHHPEFDPCCTTLDTSTSLDLLKVLPRSLELLIYTHGVPYMDTPKLAETESFLDGLTALVRAKPTHGLALRGICLMDLRYVIIREHNGTVHFKKPVGKIKYEIEAPPGAFERLEKAAHETDVVISIDDRTHRFDPDYKHSVCTICPPKAAWLTVRGTTPAHTWLKRRELRRQRELRRPRELRRQEYL